MNQASSSSGLTVPGTSSNPARHQLRQRSPRGQRGRPRRGLPAPRLTLIARYKALKQSPWFLPCLCIAVVVFLGLLYSAISISSHSADLFQPHITREPTPVRPAKRPRVGRPGAADTAQRGGSASSEDKKEDESGEKVEQEYELHAGQALDDAVRHALEETWHLPPHAGAEPPSPDEGTGTDGQAASAPKPTQRTLAELYQDLDDLGISYEELNEVMQEALADER
ncbi:hypothetical protein JCM21900_006530 [Sporobolomyces salmonicolor]